MSPPSTKPPKTKPSRRPSPQPAWRRETVLERIRILFLQAEKSFKGHPERSRRYVEMAIRLSTRYNVRLPPEIKRRFCRHCRSFLVPGVNSRIRTSPSQGAVIVNCMECGHVTRHPYRREKSAHGRSGTQGTTRQHSASGTCRQQTDGIAAGAASRILKDTGNRHPKGNGPDATSEQHANLRNNANILNNPYKI